MTHTRTAVGWALLVAVSAGLTLLLAAAGMPAAALLGPMLVAIALAAGGLKLDVPKPGFLAAQAIIGCLVAHAVTPDFVRTFVADAPLMLAVVLVTVFAGALVGLVLTRLRVLPGTSAAWGSSPGGAAAMVAMAEDHGADVRLVAFMQYVRVALVVLVAALVTHWNAASAPPLSPGDTDGLWGLLVTLAVAGLGAALAARLRLPSGAMIGPMLLGAGLQGAGLVHVAVPGPLLYGAYAVIGWYVGLRFTRETVTRTLHALPAVITATLALIALCAGWAWGLTRLLPVDFLTAFLATSPGGLDSVAIIAVGAKADVSFVLSIQTLRLLVVLLTGPLLAKWITRILPGAREGPEA